MVQIFDKLRIAGTDITGLAISTLATIDNYRTVAMKTENGKIIILPCQAFIKEEEQS